MTTLTISMNKPDNRSAIPWFISCAIIIEPNTIKKTINNINDVNEMENNVAFRHRNASS